MAAEVQGSDFVPLVAEHEIVHLPSASALAVLREQLEGREKAPEMLAVVADPVFQPHDPRLGNPSQDRSIGNSRLRRSAQPAARAGLERLVYAGQEAETILELVPPSTRLALRGLEARRAEILNGKLSRYRILHFATHGILDDQHPELSRLALSQVDGEGKPLGDGFLYAHEIRELEFPADLVVLSACRTALGKEVRGEGLLGLTRAFMQAGAGQVVVSLWNVDDQATAELMARFYSYLLIDGLHPAAALRAAQEELRRTTPAPYFWAGFVLQGDGGRIISESL
jgi:CHAT domain-containing protein